MPTLEVLRPEPEAPWQHVLAHCADHDFFHTASYHALGERYGEGAAHLFVYHDPPHFIALPLLLRPVRAVPGLENVPGQWMDATSVYGYAGPVASHRDLPAALLDSFRSALRVALRDLRVVSTFSRLHPLVSQAPLLDGLGACDTLGRTVSIDLSLPLDEQVREYRRSLRQEIQKLRHLGVSCREDSTGRHAGDFVELYYDAMRRLGASGLYFYDPAYLGGLGAHPDTRLFTCEHEGKIIAAGLVTVYNGILQYHLAGTHRDYLKLSPLKMLIDGSRIWATERGLRICHLGGGVGAREDNIFLYKSGFSRRRHDFQVWRWIVDPSIYQRLCAARAEHDARLGLRPVSASYFPEYRTPSKTP